MQFLIFGYRFSAMNKKKSIDNLTQKDWQKIENFLRDFLSVLKGDIPERCPRCGETVESAEQHGRSIYMKPCGCRLGQGKMRDG